MSLEPPQEFLPQSLMHLTEAYLGPQEEEVVIASIIDKPHNGYKGFTQIHTALIPSAQLHAVLQCSGGIGWQVESWGPQPMVPPEGGYNGAFYVRGPEELRYETLINTWTYHNKTVLLPDNGLLMCYGLIPRYLQDGTVCWDDPSKPIYGVIRATTVSTYSIPSTYTPAQIVMRRDYLEDYLSLKGCAAVAVYYEDRYSANDPLFAALLQGEESTTLVLPGRKLTLSHLAGRHYQEAPQFARIWGCRLMLVSENRPISEEQTPLLTWPDYPNPYDPQGDKDSFGLLPMVYVQDTVLKAYEDKDDFTLYPESGGITYGGWWSTPDSDRLGRNHIGLDLHRLYEGVPIFVIEHFHRYAVPRTSVDADVATNGNRHIGNRARAVVYGYVSLLQTLSELAGKLNLFLDEEGIGSYSRENIDYYGWWTIEGFRSLGNIVPLEMTRPDFLDRCLQLFKLLENLKPTALKQILAGLGMPREAFNAFASVRLLGTLSQLATIAKAQGYDLITDFNLIYPMWDNAMIVPSLSPLFALNSLRNRQGHRNGRDAENQIHEALASFNIDVNDTRLGWGHALDRIYDTIKDSLNEIANLIATSYLP